MIDNMKYIKVREAFEDIPTDSELYIFDFDDSLAHSPSFEETILPLLKEDLQELVDRSVAYIGVNKSDIQHKDGRLYVNDPEKQIQVKGNWVRKGDSVYMVTPHKWSFIEESFPKKLTELANKYKEVRNKAIVTARPEDIREKFTELLNDLGIEYPNYGLFMFPRTEGAGAPGPWKAKTIIKLVEENPNFKHVYFYDDNPKVVNKVTREVTSYFGDSIDFKSFRVKYN